MEKKGEQTSEVDSRQVISKVLDLTLKYPGLPIAFIREKGVLRIGVLNIIVDEEDWHQTPVTLDKLVETD
jgi:hypothetical protein